MQVHSGQTQVVPRSEERSASPLRLAAAPVGNIAEISSRSWRDASRKAGGGHICSFLARNTERSIYVAAVKLPEPSISSCSACSTNAERLNLCKATR